MINAALVGLGWWGKTLVESLAAGSDVMRFTTLNTRTVSPDVEAFAKQYDLKLAPSYEAVLCVEICTCYEAGYDGFWLHRLLITKGIQQPGSRFPRASRSAAAVVTRRPIVSTPKVWCAY